MKITIKNALIISDGKKYEKLNDIYIKSGVIKKIGEKIDEISDEIIDAKGKIVMPGFIDIGCKIFENGYENKDNIIRLSQAGVKGGYTTITTSSGTKPVVDNKTVVEYIHSKTKEKGLINLYPFGNMTKGGEGKEIAEIGEMILTGAIAISDGGKSIKDTNLLRDIFLYSKMFDITIITSPIEQSLLKNGMVNYGYMSTKLGLVGIPREAEEIEISKNIILAKYTGARLHIPFITTKDGVDLIRKGKKDGVDITCSTSPHYFTLTDKAIDNYNTLAKVMPPLREDEDIVAIKEGLRDGTIDAISSGHTPSLFEKKFTEFERAEFGISGLDVAFNIVNTKLIKEDKFKIEDMSCLMSKNPAKILGFKSKGEIKEGFDADIIIIDENKKNVVNADEFLSRAKYSPYSGMKVFGEVLMTIVSGNILYRK